MRCCRRCCFHHGCYRVEPFLLLRLRATRLAFSWSPEGAGGCGCSLWVRDKACACRSICMCHAWVILSFFFFKTVASCCTHPARLKWRPGRGTYASPQRSLVDKTDSESPRRMYICPRQLKNRRSVPVASLAQTDHSCSSVSAHSSLHSTTHTERSLAPPPSLGGAMHRARQPLRHRR